MFGDYLWATRIQVAVADARLATPAGALGQSLTRLPHQHDRFREQDTDGVAHLRRLLLGLPRQIQALDAGDGHLHGQVDGVVRPGDLLDTLHLLHHVLQVALQILRVAKHATKWETTVHEPSSGSESAIDALTEG